MDSRKWRTVFGPKHSLIELSNEWLHPDDFDATHYPGAFNKNLNQFWDNYQDEDVVIIRLKITASDKVGFLISCWTDHQVFGAPVRWRDAIRIRPQKTIVVCPKGIAEMSRFSQLTKQRLAWRFGVTL